MGLTASKAQSTRPCPNRLIFLPALRNLIAVVDTTVNRQIPKRPIRFVVIADNNNGLNQQEREDEKEKEQEIGSNGGDEMGKNQRSIFSNIRGAICCWTQILTTSWPSD